MSEPKKGIPTPQQLGMKCYFDVEAVLKEKAKPDDTIEIHTFSQKDPKKDSGKTFSMEFTIAIDPVIPISKKQYAFLDKHCTLKSSDTKKRSELNEQEWRMIKRCQFINPELHEN